jgi:predicted ABC-type ATPase
MNHLEESQIVIIAGPNGAGKSTLAPILLRDEFELMEFVNADTIAIGLSAFQPERTAIEAGRVMLKRLRELVERKASFAFETTLATRSYAHWLADLRQGGYKVNLMFIWLNSPELAVERVKQRVIAGGHDIPEETIRRRYQNGVRNFFALYQPLADEWGVYDNSELVNAVLIASGGEQTTQIVFEPERWASFCEAAK